MRGSELRTLSPDLPAESSDLTLAERSALLTALEPRQLCAPLRAARRVLKRFLAPIEDAAVTLGLSESARQKVQRNVLQGMLKYDAAWTRWERTHWIEVARSAGPYRANTLAVAAQLGALGGDDLVCAGGQPTNLARRLFGRAALECEVGRVREYLLAVGYGRKAGEYESLVAALAALFLRVGKADLAAITLGVIESAHAVQPPRSAPRTAYFRIGHVLHGMGLLPRRLRNRTYPTDAMADVSPEWAAWCTRWRATSTLSPKSVDGVCHGALRAGRWLARNHPQVCSPDDWTRDIALEYVTSLNQAEVGEFVTTSATGKRGGAPLSPRSKDRYLATLRIFFRDCQEWGWCARHFDPGRALATPKAVKALIAPNPRVIADEQWAKLLWAGLHLEETDLKRGRSDPDLVGRGRAVYPFALVKATAVAWLFAGLRSDELLRLRVGCVRWQHEGGPAAATSHVPGDEATCLLDVPTHKTGASYTKPVDPLLGEAIGAWEAIRPQQPLLIDRKTGERVAVLFCFRGRPLSTDYFNSTLIPMLCRKAGVPLRDARGRITSHRARATIASQLYNAKEPMTLFELQAWLGHQTPQSTQHYARITPTTLAKAYRDAGYFARNVRTIEVLIDRDAVQHGAAARGAPWQYFDLGHGYCTYSFFEQCPHRMACARCDFYLPKNSTKAQLLEAQGNLQRMLAQIPLTDDERAAVEDGADAVDRLIQRLHDVPTPTGATPRQLSETNFVPLTALTHGGKPSFAETC
jgi:integrase